MTDTPNNVPDFDQQLKELVRPLLVSYLSSESGQEVLKKHLESTFEASIKEALRYHSEFRNELESVLKKAFSLANLDDLSTYNAAILEIVRRKVEKRRDDTILAEVSATLDKLLEPIPTEISVSDLFDKYVEYLGDQVSEDCDCSFTEDERTATCIVEHDPHGTLFRSIGLDPTRKRKRGECEIQLQIYRDKFYSVKFRNQSKEELLFRGPYYDFERLLFQMSRRETVITGLDEDELHQAYGRSDD